MRTSTNAPSPPRPCTPRRRCLPARPVTQPRPIVFPQGLPGFPGATRFALRPAPRERVPAAAVGRRSAAAPARAALRRPKLPLQPGRSRAACASSASGPRMRPSCSSSPAGCEPARTAIGEQRLYVNLRAPLFVDRSGGRPRSTCWRARPTRSGICCRRPDPLVAEILFTLGRTRVARPAWTSQIQTTRGLTLAATGAARAVARTWMRRHDATPGFALVGARRSGLAGGGLAPDRRGPTFSPWTLTAAWSRWRRCSSGPRRRWSTCRSRAGMPRSTEPAVRRPVLPALLRRARATPGRAAGDQRRLRRDHRRPPRLRADQPSRRGNADRITVTLKDRREFAPSWSAAIPAPTWRCCASRPAISPSCRSAIRTG